MERWESACHILLSDAGWKNSRKTLIVRGFTKAQRAKRTYLDSSGTLSYLQSIKRVVA